MKALWRNKPVQVLAFWGNGYATMICLGKGGHSQPRPGIAAFPHSLQTGQAGPWPRKAPSLEELVSALWHAERVFLILRSVYSCCVLFQLDNIQRGKNTSGKAEKPLGAGGMEWTLEWQVSRQSFTWFEKRNCSFICPYAACAWLEHLMMRYLNCLCCHFDTCTLKLIIVECLAEAIKRKGYLKKMLRGFNQWKLRESLVNLILLSSKFSNVHFQNKMWQ